MIPPAGPITQPAGPLIPPAVDVLVAGSGAAGLTAALAAAVAGASVLLAERGDRLGGTTALSGGRVWIPGNHLGGAEDPPDAAARYLDGIFSGRYPQMISAFLRSAPEMARFVERHSPHRFAACPRYPDYDPGRPGATAGGRSLDMTPIDVSKLTPLVADILVPPGYLPLSFAEWERWRYPPRFDWELLGQRERSGIRTGGVALVAGLLDGVIQAGVQVVTGARLTGIELTGIELAGVQRDGGRIRAARLEHAGQQVRVATRAVILATGGFDWDHDLRARVLPAALRASGAPPTNTGDALRIAAQAGAALDNMGEGWWMPMLAIPGETLLGEQFYRSLIRERGLPRQIMVNAAGRRFVSEAQPYNEIGKALHRQHGPVHLVFDAGYRARYPLPGLPGDGPVPDWVARGGSLADLAARIGVDPAALQETVRRWNASCAAGTDQDFHRGENAYERYCGDPATQPNPGLGPLDTAPYYAVQVLAGTIGTKGGPVTGTDGAVLGAAGAPVPGLYAAGNAAAFWTADGYPGPGATLAVGMTMGYRAGRHAGRTVR